MHKEEDFKPKTVDERIDQLANNLNRRWGDRPTSPDEQIVDTLQHIYRQELSMKDHHSLLRIKQRILDGRAAGISADTALEEYSKRHIIQKEKGRSSPLYIQPVSPVFGFTNNSKSTKRTAFYHWLNSLAAAVIVGLLIGSWFVVTSGIHHRLSLAGQPVVQKNIYTVDQHNVYKLSAKTGALIWKQPISDNVQTSYYLNVADGIVLLETGQVNPSLYVLRAGDGAILWQIKMAQKHYAVYPTPQETGNTVLVFNYDGELVGLNAKDGSEKWRVATLTKEEMTSVKNFYQKVGDIDFYIKGATTSTSDENVYLKVNNGKLSALDAATGKERWHYLEAAQFPGNLLPPILSSAIIEKGIVYDASRNNLYALNEQDGQLLWSRQVAGDQYIESLQISGDQIYAHSTPLSSVGKAGSADLSNDYITAFNAKSGQAQWAAQGFDLFGGVSTIPLVDIPGNVFLSSQPPDSFAYNVLNAKDGTVALKIDQECRTGTRVTCIREPVQVTNQKMYVLERQRQNRCFLDTFDVNTGKRVAQFPINGILYFSLSPVADDGILYLAAPSPLTVQSKIAIYAINMDNGTVLWKSTLDQTIPLEPASIYTIVAP